MQISNRLQDTNASQSLQMAARCKQMKEEGIDVISMALGEPDMETPYSIREAVKNAVDENWSHYGPVAGLPSLRAAIASKQNRLYGNAIDWKGEDVMVSAGAKLALYTIIQTAINPGDEVIIPTPSWVSYCEMVKLAGGKVIAPATNEQNNYCLTADLLRKVITARTRMIILCSPNNPTGTVYSKQQLDAIVEVLRDWPDVIIVSDEIYNSITYDAPAVSLAAYPEISNQLIIVNGVSKTYAMTGYRIGWLLTKDSEFLQACIRLQSQHLSCATMVAQRATEAALNNAGKEAEEIRQKFAKRKELICRLGKEIEDLRFIEPQGAFYIFSNVSSLFGKKYGKQILHSSNDVVDFLFNEAHVATVSGSAFGDPNCIRLSYAISEEEITKAMSRIKEAIKSLS